MGIPFRRDDALAPGAVEETVPGLVRRILCDNPSAFTFRGTNTYLIGARPEAWRCSTRGRRTRRISPRSSPRRAAKG